jgi:putative oxygen-independent coproporphyrinogen III oxidase
MAAMAESRRQVVSLQATPGAAGVAPPPPLSLYVHLPWCVRKCPYCDFNSHEKRGELDEDGYVDTLIADLESALPQVWGRGVQTVFLGGGTPSLFSPEAIDRLLSGIRARVSLAPGAEITMEANPGTFERERFEGYAQAGVNRLSIGVQSFSDRALRAIGRIHDGDQARAAIETAARCFETFNIDLMYALPGQSLAECEADLRAALAWNPPHLSCYHLTIEPNTLFAARPPLVPDEDEAADMQQMVEELLGGAGLENYEISAWARPGHRSRHNLNYWQFGDYLGIGAGAHGKLSFHDRIEREQRWRHPVRYRQAVAAGEPVEVRRRLSPADLRFEFMLNALRLTEGLPAALFTAHTGLGMDTFGKTLARAADDGLLDPDPTRIRATELGRRFLNDLQQRFLPDTGRES